MREHYNDEELEAARILDAVKLGIEVPESAIKWSLWVLGDGVNFKEST